MIELKKITPRKTRDEYIKNHLFEGVNIYLEKKPIMETTIN